MRIAASRPLEKSIPSQPPEPSAGVPSPEAVAIGPDAFRLPPISGSAEPPDAGIVLDVADVLTSAHHPSPSSIYTLWKLPTVAQEFDVIVHDPKLDNTQRRLMVGMKCHDVASAIYAESPGPPRLHPNLADTVGLRPEEAVFEAIPIMLETLLLVHDHKHGTLTQLQVRLAIVRLFLYALSLICQYLGWHHFAYVVKVTVVAAKIADRCQLIYVSKNPGAPVGVVGGDIASLRSCKPIMLSPPRPVA